MAKRSSKGGDKPPRILNAHPHKPGSSRPPVRHAAPSTAEKTLIRLQREARLARIEVLLRSADGDDAKALKDEQERLQEESKADNEQIGAPVRSVVPAPDPAKPADPTPSLYDPEGHRTKKGRQPKPPPQSGRT